MEIWVRAYQTTVSIHESRGEENSNNQKADLRKILNLNVSSKNSEPQVTHMFVCLVESRLWIYIYRTGFQLLFPIFLYSNK